MNDIFEPALLLPILNTVFLAAIPITLAFMTVRTYRISGARTFLFLGCGLLSYGLGCLTGGWGLGFAGENLSVTMHDAGSLMGGSFHLLGALQALSDSVPSDRGKRRHVSVTASVSCAGIAIVQTLLLLLTLRHVTPTFFVQGVGPTFLRQAVMSLAAVFFIASGLILAIRFRRSGAGFISYYAIGLWLLAAGLLVVLMVQSLGSLLSWVGRVSQYAGSACLMMGAIKALRESRAEATTLPRFLTAVLRGQIESEVILRTEEQTLLNQLLLKEVMERVRTEEALRRSQDELKAIYDHAPMLMCTLDADRRVLHANKAFTEYTRAPGAGNLTDRAEGVLGCINGKDDPRGCGFGPRCQDCRLRLSVEETLVTGRSHLDFEFRATLGQNGVLREVVLLGSTVRISDADGPVILLCVQDITERERDKEDLRIVNDFVLTTGGTKGVDELTRLAARAVHAVHPDSYVLVSFHDAVLGGPRVRAMEGPGDRRAAIHDLLDADPTSVGGPISSMGESARAVSGLFTSGRLEEVPGGLSTLGDGMVSPDICRAATELLGIERVFTVGLSLGSAVMGGISLLLPRGSPPPRHAVVETLARHLAVLLNRAAAGDALAESERDLREAHQHLRNLAAHLLRAREVERRKVAQEIHDELGQMLTALKIDMQWVVKRIASGPGAVLEKLQGAVTLADQTIGIVQRISSDLRPKMLDDLGLAAALDWLGKDFERRTEIAFETSTDIPDDLIGDNAAIALYRAAQEAFTNVVRHAHAHHVTLGLRVIEGTLEMRIQDDGVGITREQVASRQSYGLMGIRERAEAFGGAAAIHGTPGHGTGLVVTIPIPADGVLP